MFWPEYDQRHALANLRRVLHSLNRNLIPGAIAAGGEAIRFCPAGDIWLVDSLDTAAPLALISAAAGFGKTAFSKGDTVNSNHTVAPPGDVVPGTARQSARAVVWMAPVLLLGLAAPFIGAGTLAWPPAWLYVGLTLAAGIISRAVMLRAHPELAAERSAFMANPGTMNWDRILAPLVLAGPTVITLVAGLNHRLRWSPGVAPALQILAVAVLLASFALSSWAMAANPFFSSVVRIQVERGHHAISLGPYRFVRHPAYAATIPAQFSFALMLGSAWALIPAALVAAVLVLRTILEDRALMAGLPGYPGYAAQVRSRLLPGVW